MSYVKEFIAAERQNSINDLYCRFVVDFVKASVQRGKCNAR